ncbi:MAG: S1 RNA-binding domain-containing protein [Promethearchaeota archaeon]
MVRSRNKFPREGEFVIGRVRDIQNQYVYVDLTDYEGLPSDKYATGMIHISEISSRWIKNIRTFVRVGQRVVLRVLKVDSYKGHIDLSLRRVNSAQKEIRLKEWKYGLKFENLMQFLSEAENINITFDEAYDLIGFPVLEYYRTYQEAIEALKEDGKEVLKKIENVSEDVKEVFLKIIDENVKISTVSIIGKIKLIFTSENGIDLIKETLLEVKKVIKNPKETRNLNITYIGTPFYRLEIVSKDYLDAEGLLSDVLEIIEEKTSKYKGQFEYIRD